MTIITARRNTTRSHSAGGVTRSREAKQFSTQIGAFLNRLHDLFLEPLELLLTLNPSSCEGRTGIVAFRSAAGIFLCHLRKRLSARDRSIEDRLELDLLSLIRSPMADLALNDRLKAPSQVRVRLH